MRYGLTGVLAVWLCGAGLLPGQEPPANKPAAQDAPAPAAAPKPATPPEPGAPAGGGATAGGGAGGTGNTADAAKAACDCPPFHGWARAEYLFWWMKAAPRPVPIVTTGDPRVGLDPTNANTVNTAGAIGQPGTLILFGGHPAGYKPFSGLRLAAGVWAADDETFGVEGSGFVFERLTHSFALKSDAKGNGPIYFPIFSAIADAERAVPIADPLRGFSGGVDARTTLRLWGAEGNGVVALVRNPGLELTALAGTRYADLREHLIIDNTTTDLIFGNVTELKDLFATENQFYGGQLGGRLVVCVERFTVDVTGKVAMGITHEAVEVNGLIAQTGPNAVVPPVLFPGGMFAQLSNIGRRTANRVAVLPSLEVRLGYNLTPWARVFTGYDAMYWSQVVRPGDQVSHAVNLTQNAVLSPTGGGTLVGPAEPAPLFNRSSFWAQGLTFGLEVYF